MAQRETYVVAESRIASVLSYMYMIRVSVPSHLLSIFYSDYKQNWGYRKLRALEQEGLIQSEWGYFDGHPTRFISLAPKAAERIMEYHPQLSQKMRNFKRRAGNRWDMLFREPDGSISHQLRLGEMLMDVFHEIGWENWQQIVPLYTTSRLPYMDGTTRKYLVPDLMFETGDIPGKALVFGSRAKETNWTFLELDNGTEKPEQLREKFSSYRAYFNSEEGFLSETDGYKTIALSCFLRNDSPMGRAARLTELRKVVQREFMNLGRGIWQPNGKNVVRVEPQVDVLIGFHDQLGPYLGNLLVSNVHPDLYAGRQVRRWLKEQDCQVKLSEQLPQFDGEFPARSYVQVRSNEFNLNTVVMDFRYRLRWQWMADPYLSYATKLSEQINQKVGILGVIKENEELRMKPHPYLVLLVEDRIEQGLPLLECLLVQGMDSHGRKNWTTLAQSQMATAKE